MPDIKPYVVQPILQAQSSLAALNIAFRKCKPTEAITIPIDGGSLSLTPTSDNRHLLTITAVVDIPSPRHRTGGKSA